MKFPPSQSSYKKNENLDATASQESSSLGGCWVGSLTTSAVQSPGSEGTRCKPEDGGEESESEGGLELLAVVGSRIVPWVEVPARAAAAVWQPVNKKTEGNNPQNEHDKVKWPKGEGPSHWQEKEDGEEQGEASDDFGVDHAFSWRSIGLVSSAKLVADETGNDGGRDKLKHAECESGDTGDLWHCECVVVVVVEGICVDCLVF